MGVPLTYRVIYYAAESPQLVASEPRAVPEGIDAVAWVEALFAAR
jgi:hypothetical protein